MTYISSPNFMRKILVLSLLLIHLSLIFTSCEDDGTKWSYSEGVDPMTSKKNYSALLVSDDEIYFDHNNRIQKYGTGVYPELEVRDFAGVNEITLSTHSDNPYHSGGYFVSSLDSIDLLVKFDNKPPLTFKCSFPSDNSQDVVFIDSAQTFIQQLRTTDTLLVKAEFYDHGSEVFKFITKGLKWNHADSVKTTMGSSYITKRVR